MSKTKFSEDIMQFDSNRLKGAVSANDLADNGGLFMKDTFDGKCVDLNQGSTSLSIDLANSDNVISPNESTINGQEEAPVEDFIIIHMDIRQPLSMLKTLLQKKVNIDLTPCPFTLQQTVQLGSSSNLADLCVQGEGIVQINVRLNETTVPQTIDIIDVLEPDDDFVKESKLPVKGATLGNDEAIAGGSSYEVNSLPLPPGWVQDVNFTCQLVRLNIPLDPMKWKPAHVKHWLIWAVRKFNLVGINLQEWIHMHGYTVCSMGKREFNKKVPSDPDNLFWLHILILKIHRTVAVRALEEEKSGSDQGTKVSAQPSGSPPPPPSKPTLTPPEASTSAPKTEINKKNTNQVEKEKVTKVWLVPSETKEKILPNAYVPSSLTSKYSHTPTVNDFKNNRQANSRPSLWKFLLELLMDWKQRSNIQWLGETGEFIFIKPEYVAKLWGLVKSKPNMTYDKLSRALRFYYDGNMISKVPGKKLVYKFVCDLKFLLGYSPQELNERVLEAERKFKKKDKNEVMSMEYVIT